MARLPGNSNPGRDRKGVARQGNHFPARLFWLLVSGLIVMNGLEGASPRSESEVRALYLLKFLKFVEWPQGEMEEGPLRIGVVGETEVKAILDGLTRKTVLGGREVVVETVSVNREFASCHVLFVTDSARRQLPRVLIALRNKPVLTVGEWEGFLKEGGMISLVRRNTQMRCRLNLEATVKAGLKVHSKLIAVADVVKGEPDA